MKTLIAKETFKMTDGEVFVEANKEYNVVRENNETICIGTLMAEDHTFHKDAASPHYYGKYFRIENEEVVKTEDVSPTIESPAKRTQEKPQQKHQKKK